jgi:hypothetical protein
LRTKHLVIASFDGLVTHYCGVGAIVRNMVRILNDMSPAKNLKVSLAYIAADPKGKVFNATCYMESYELTRKTGGYMIPLSNGTSGYDEEDMWKSFPEWHYLSASLSTSLNLVLNHYDDNILILHGTPLLAFSKFREQLFLGNLRIFYFLHSTGLSHTFGDIKWRKKRIELERECFNIVRNDSNSRIVAVGDHFARHLRTDYSLEVSGNQIVRNGLYFRQFEEWLERSVSVEKLADVGINLPRDARILFSWGRCSVVKGFRELLRAWRRVHSQLQKHYLVIQCPNNSGENEYSAAVRKLAGMIPRTILLDDFNPVIWESVLRSPNTDVVCIPSLRDTNPLTAMEAKFFLSGMNYVIIASNRDGLNDSFSDGECYWIDPSDEKGFAETIVRAAGTGSEKRKYMSELNKGSVVRFDYSKNFGAFLREHQITTGNDD